jgi:16S rRNA U516 pseudouridylate synthase RsuA-like enzyme
VRFAGEVPGRRDRPLSRLEITLREGRQRQVRRMCEAVGHPVERLTRVRIGPLADARLPAGAWRELTEQEVRRLRAAAEDESRRSGADRRTPDRSGSRGR